MNLSKNTNEIINVNTIPFGKYKGQNIDVLLRDRKYCMWLIDQPWFYEQFPYLYEKVNEYKPEAKYEWKVKEMGIEQFINSYPLFFLKEIKNLKENEEICYLFYRQILADIKDKIIAANSFDIKAPSAWLNRLEKEYHISRDFFKEFLHAHGLPNITSVIETVKKHGGIEYKGAKSFIIAKKNSLNQEAYWEKRLKEIFGDSISCQYIFNHCIFDFLNIKDKIVYECKLSIKDFDENQYKRYLSVMKNYKVIYLIGTEGKETIIDMSKKEIYTKDPLFELQFFEETKGSVKLQQLIEDFTIKNIKSIRDVLK